MSSPQPTDSKLYQQVKQNIYRKYPKHSAYRSGLLVQAYKKEFKKRFGNRSPYSGKRSKRSGLSRWYLEKWRNQRGSVGYTSRSDIYRPTRRITRKTPTTFSELSSKQIQKARKEKYRSGRVRRFKK
jgi:hypothetical protein